MFERAFVIKSTYSGSTLISNEVHVPGKVGAQSTSNYEYDDKGRLDYSVSFDEYGDTSGYEKLTYPATEANNFKPGEPQGYFNFIYGDAASYQPQSSLIYSSSVGIPSTIDWVNTGNQDGYLLSSTGTIAGSAYQTITYTYDCVDK